jgi:hypothetical protein
MPAPLIQAKAFLLLTTFLSAGTSLPSLDALAYHHEEIGSERSRPHVDPAGGCPSHADDCSLGRNAPGSNAGLAGSRELRLDPDLAPTHQLHTVPAPAHAASLGIPQPRAPPVQFV